MIERKAKRKQTLTLLSRKELAQTLAFREKNALLEQEFSEARGKRDETREVYRGAEHALSRMLSGASNLDLHRMARLREFLSATEESLVAAEQEFMDAKDRYEKSLALLKSSELNQRLFDKTIAGLGSEIQVLKERDAERAVTELWVSSQWMGG